MKIFDVFSKMQLKSKLAKYYCHTSIRYLGLELIYILLPVYLLILGFSITTALIWFLMQRVFQFLFVLCAVPIANRFGIKFSLLLGLVAEALFLLTIPLIGQSILILFLVAILHSFASSIYWTNELTMFMEISKKMHEGFERGVAETVASMASMASPLVGALILVGLGMSYLSVTAATILILSYLPLAFIGGLKFRIDMNLKNLSKSIRKYRLKRKTILQILNRGMQSEVIYTLWPIFLFVSGIQIIEIGIVGLLLGLASTLTPLLLGKFADLDHTKLMRLSTLGMLAVWLVAIFTKNSIILYLLSFLIGILTESLWLAINKRMTMLGKKYNASYFGVVHELSDVFSKGLILVILVPLVFFFGINIVFIVMAIASVLFLLLI